MQHLQGQSLGCTKLIAISDITSVERVDKYVFGHKHILQILISKNNERPSVLYMKLKVWWVVYFEYTFIIVY